MKKKLINPNVIKGALAAAALLAGIIFAACSNPLSPGSSANSRSASGGDVYITQFAIKQKGSGLIVTQGVGIGSNSISSSASAAVLIDGKNQMGITATDPNGNEYVTDGDAVLIPVVSASPGAVVIPLTERYLRKAFITDAVYWAALDWAERLKTIPAGSGLESQYILELIKQQNSTGEKFVKPVMGDPEWELPCDFTTPTDIVVVSGSGATRHYKIILTPFTAIPVFVNQETGDDGNSGSSWGDPLKSLRKALDMPNPNADETVAKEIWLAGGKASDGKARTYYLQDSTFKKPGSDDPDWFRAVDDGNSETARRIPPIGGIKIKGGFRGIEASGNSRDATNDINLYPVEIRFWAASDAGFENTARPPVPAETAGGIPTSNRVANPALQILGVPFTLESVVLNAADEDWDGSRVTGDKLVDSTAVFVGSSIALEKRLQGLKTGSLTLNAGARIINGQNFSTIKGDGGGVFVTDNATLVLNGGEICGNTALNGGGVYINWGLINIRGGRIAGNVAGNPRAISTLTGGNGGGVYVAAVSTGSAANIKIGKVNFTAGQVTGNYAKADTTGTTGEGGGIYVATAKEPNPNPQNVERGEVYMGVGSRNLAAGSRPEINGNIAGLYGGGVFYERGALFKKLGDTAGDPSGKVTGLDDGWPTKYSLIPSGSSYAASPANGYKPLSTSNVAFGGTEPPTIPIDMENYKKIGYGHAVYCTPDRKRDEALGSYDSFDSDNPTSGSNIDGGRIQEFTVLYNNQADDPAYTFPNFTDTRELRVAVVQDVPDASGTSYQPGKITIFVPAPLIDRYNTITGGPQINLSQTTIIANNDALLWQFPYDIRTSQAGSPLSILFPTKADLVKQIAERYTDNVPVTSSNYANLVINATNIYNDLKAQIQADNAYDFISGKNAYAAARPGNNAYKLENGPTITDPPPVNYGFAPWYVIIDGSATPHVYYTEIILESGAPLYVDHDNTNATKDGKSWGRAFQTVAAAVTAAPNNIPTEIWIKNGISNTTISVPANKKITFVGGFIGNELTKKQRGNAYTSTVTIGFGTVSANSALGFEDITVSSDIVISSGGNTVTLGKGAKMTGGIAGINAQVELKENAVMDASGVADKTGISLKNSMLVMNGTSSIQNYSKGGVYLDGTNMTMNDSSQLQANKITHAATPDLKPIATPIVNNTKAVAAGITLYNSNLTLNDLDTLSDPVRYGPGGTEPLTNPVQIRENIATTSNSGIKTFGGGLYAKASTITFTKGTPTLAGAKVIGNKIEMNAGSAGGNGGGLYLDSGTTMYFNKGEISNNRVAGTLVNNTGDGGGVYLAGPNDVGPGKFVNEQTTTIVGTPAPYNNGVVLNMNDAAIISNITAPAALVISAIVSGNTAASRGGGVFLSPGSELLKANTPVPAAPASNTKGIIYGNVTQGFANTANNGSALYDMNSTWPGGYLYCVAVDRNIFNGINGIDTRSGEPAYANYPPDLNYTDGQTAINKSSYNQAAAPNSDSTLLEFSLVNASATEEFPGTIVNYNSTGYMHPGKNIGDPHAAATGVIELTLPLSKVTAPGTTTPVNFNIKVKGQDSTQTASKQGIKVFLPPEMYTSRDAALSGTFPASKGVSNISGGVVSHGSPKGDHASFLEVVNAMAGIPTDVPDELIKQIQWEADNDLGGIVFGTVGENSLYALPAPNTGDGVSLFAPDENNMAGSTPFILVGPTGLASNGPTFTFAAEEKLNTIYFYVVTESGNVRRYKLIVDVYTAKPYYVNDGVTNWGRNPGSTLSTALTSAETDENSVDIWVKKTATGWTDTSPRAFNESPVTIIGGFEGTEAAPGARKTRYAHEYEFGSFKDATYHPDRTIKQRTKGENTTVINMGGDLTISGVMVKFRDINVNMGTYQVIVEQGGQLILENAQLISTHAIGLTIKSAGKVELRNSSMLNKKESLLEFQNIFVGEPGGDKTSGTLNVNYGTVIIKGAPDHNAADPANSRGLVVQNTGSKLQLGLPTGTLAGEDPDTQHESAIKYLNNSNLTTPTGLVQVTGGTTGQTIFTMKRGVIDGYWNDIGNNLIGVQVSAGTTTAELGGSFIMENGIIRGMTHTGVRVEKFANFDKKKATTPVYNTIIYGNTADQTGPSQDEAIQGRRSNRRSIHDMLYFYNDNSYHTGGNGANIPNVDGVSDFLVGVTTFETDPSALLSGALWTGTFDENTSYKRAVALNDKYDLAVSGSASAAFRYVIVNLIGGTYENGGSGSISNGANIGGSSSPTQVDNGSKSLVTAASLSSISMRIDNTTSLTPQVAISYYVIVNKISMAVQATWITTMTSN